MPEPAIFKKSKKYKSNRTHPVDRTTSPRRRAGGKRNKKLNNVIQRWTHDKRAR